jgi:glycosyltransferase involved in cell wall biosynthesis
VSANTPVAPLISVLMPVRNGMGYIGEAIDSIQAQTLIDWELVISDNASTDGTDGYVRRRAAEDPRIVFSRNDEDLGVAGNLNAGLALCRGEWIARMDADDRAMPNRLERQLAFMLQNRDVAVVSCLAYYINAAGDRMARTSHDLTSREAFWGYMQRNEVIGVLHPGAFMRREVLNGAGGYRAQFETAEDIDLWNRLAETGPILVQTEYLMEYRVHGSSQVARFFDAAHQKHLWAEECMLARRAGNPEPTWEQFLWRQRSRPLNERLTHSRIALGRRLYREAGECKINGRVISAALRFAGAVALRPAYSSGRLRSQLLHKCEDDVSTLDERLEKAAVSRKAQGA